MGHRANGDERDTAPSGRHWPFDRLALAVITVVALLRALRWALMTPVPFGDEVAHYSYVQWLATGRGIPTMVRDHATQAALQLAKSSPAVGARGAPLPPVPSHWGLLGMQYEGFQAPFYYVILVPAYWFGRAVGGILGSFWAMRMLNVAFIAAAPVATYFLARLVFPRRRAVWLLSAAVAASVQIFSSAAMVANDSITPVAAAVALMVVLRSGRAPGWKSGVAAGAATALAFLSKTVAVAVLPAIALAVGWYLVTRRPPVRVAAAWLGGAVATGVAVVLPWVAFNYHAYHALSGGRVQARLVVHTLGRTPPGWAGFKKLVNGSVRSLFTGRSSAPTAVALHRGWDWVAVGTAASAVLGSIASRRKGEMAAVGWLVLSLPLGLFVLVISVLQESGAGAEVTGRHLDVLLPLFSILVAYGFVSVLGSTAGSTLLLAGLCAAAFLEVPSENSWVRTTYTAGLIGSSAPVVAQTYADFVASTGHVEVQSPCSPTAVGFLLQSAPGAVRVDSRAPSATVSKAPWTVFLVSGARPGTLSVDFSPPVALAASSVAGRSAVSKVPGGRPAIEVYCVVAHPSEYRFTSLYRPDHPYLMSLRALLDWPTVMAWGECVLSAAALVVVLQVRRSRTRRRRGPDDRVSGDRQMAVDHRADPAAAD